MVCNKAFPMYLSVLKGRKERQQFLLAQKEYEAAVAAAEAAASSGNGISGGLTIDDM